MTEAQIEAKEIGYNINDHFYNKNNKFFVGIAVDYIYNYQGILYVKLKYGSYFEDSFDLSNFIKY